MKHEELNKITGEIVDAAMKVHRELGPGLLESAYQACLLFEMHRRGYKAEKEVELPIVYDGVRIDAGYRIDLLVEGCVIVEIKAVEKVHDVHKAQLISYLKLSGNKVGLLINFNVVLLKDGIMRFAN
ncbi:MAG: GxxExxY protein [Planctomycetota bacterium]|nr:GxxExxY protein [Planctomycetota bacterium]